MATLLLIQPALYVNIKNNKPRTFLYGVPV